MNKTEIESKKMPLLELLWKIDHIGTIDKIIQIINDNSRNITISFQYIEGDLTQTLRLNFLLNKEEFKKYLLLERVEHEKIFKDYQKQLVEILK